MARGNNMYEQGVRGLVVYWLNHCCRHRTIVNVDEWPPEVEDASFGLSVFQVPRRRVEVRLNWKEARRVSRLAWAAELGYVIPAHEA